MKKLAICFTEQGKQVIERLKEKQDIEGRYFGDLSGMSISDWTKNAFVPGNALIFVGAVGIAVRAVSEVLKDKLTDCPVIVIDDNGQFVIPILSGHAGGGNKLAMILSDCLGAVPVITTSTDVNGAFSVDTFAAENRLTIADRHGIKKVSVKAVEGKKITLSIKDFPPKEKTDVIVADETDREYSLLLRPKKYTVGLGMKKGTRSEDLDTFFEENLKEKGLSPEDIYALCTIDIKEDEEALKALRDRYRIPVLSFDKDLLKKAEGSFSSSEFVEKTVGVDNVCERAAILGTGNAGELIMKKTAKDGMTMAIAKRGL